MDLQAIKKEIAAEIKQLTRVYAALNGNKLKSSVVDIAEPQPKRRKMSKAARMRIAAAQRARWAKTKRKAA